MGAHEFLPGDSSQTISFPELEEMKIGDPDFEGKATASSGLPIIYRSDNNNVAAIINNKIQLRGTGTANIIATQPGNDLFFSAGPIVRPLTVTGGITDYLIENSSFDTGTEDWSITVKNPGEVSLQSLTNPEIKSDVLMVDIINGGLSSAWDMQVKHPLPIEKKKMYHIGFTISSDTICNINIELQSGNSPWTIYKLYGD
jgi:hypothetical protein